ncbi:hypothetical protein [Sphingomonas alba]|uniref:Uncharacterized protein n=1 Tax=Sphingomonas alba TaxID=2908208 RepID=A0ABT0RKI7_9SPHN|nr:hypothetical protein [Sphingomonas alba]MCL6682957.1 hypothetical protein [Sphingomonas alba]
MDEIDHEPESNLALATTLEDSFFETRRFRNDGWDGPTKALFCRTLAETGIVRDACRACNMSAKSAYALRHRDPLFARAWEAALSMARERLADELLARSLKGSAEQIVRDGCIWGERHHFDNKLAFSILRRLDRRAELGSTFKTPAAWEMPATPPALTGEWQLVLDAMSEDRIADAERLLTPKPKGNGGNDPPFSLDSEEENEGDSEPEAPQRVWRDWEDEWRTDFPAPAGFDGDEWGSWDDEEGYSRTLTQDERAALAAAGMIRIEETIEISIEEDEAARDAFFAALRTVTPANEPGSACLQPQQGKADAGSSPA